jgi:predicted nucleotidyltransferase
MIENIIILIRNAYPTALSIYVYGSYARGTNTPDSDVDICVLMPADVLVTRYNFTLNKIISKQVGKDVHIVFCTKHNAWCEKIIWQDETK